MLLIETDKSSARQRQGRIARLYLLENVVVAAVIIEFDLVGQLIWQTLAQSLAEGRTQTLRVLGDANIDGGWNSK